MSDDYRKLGLGTAASVIVGLSISDSTQNLLVRGLYDPEIRRPFVISFADFRELQIERYHADAPAVLETPLIGIQLGESEYKSPATITTGAFELRILYRKFLVT
jgi:hypothetical protein